MRRGLKTIPLRIRTLFRKGNVEADLREEMAFHLDTQVEELMNRGYSERDARGLAMKAMKIEREMEKCRDERAWQGWEKLKADIVFGWRQLKKRKVTTAAAVLSLGLAIGSCMAAFRLVDALFLHPLPVSDPKSLYAVFYQGPGGRGLPGISDSSSYPMFQAMRERVRGQATLVLNSYISKNDLTYGGYQDTEQAVVEPVSGELFSNFGLKPTQGRLIDAQDDSAPKISAVAVLSYDYWTRRFGRDASVIGKKFQRHDDVYQIVGVAPKGFVGTQPGTMVDIFTPTMMDPEATRKNTQDSLIFVRPLPGVNLQILQSELDAVYQSMEKERAKSFNDLPPDELANFPNRHLLLKPAGGGISYLQSDYGSALTVMGLLVGLVLLIACANVANLMAGQAAARAREMALRLSLGAGRRRLIRLVMVESTMLGIMATIAGVVFAAWAAPAVVAKMGSPSNPLRLELPTDWFVLGFGLLLAMIVTLLFGLAPALRASHVQPVSALKGGAEPHAHRRLMHSLIAAQVAFCFVVLFVSGLFAATSQHLLHRSLGFTPDGLLLLDTSAQQPEQPTRWDAVLSAVRQTPGVESASVASRPLVGGGSWNDSITVDGVPHTELLVYFLTLAPGWLETNHLPLLSGRDIRDSDRHDTTAIVNETFVKTYFDGKDPVGRTFTGLDSKVPITIVGVVADAPYKGLRAEMVAQAYQPMRADDGKGGLKEVRSATLAVRTKGDPTALAETLRKTVSNADSEFRVSTVRTQNELIANQMLREQMLAALGGFFAVVALLLAAIGLYGVLHYSVIQREKELGIRIALGAAAANIARVVTLRVLMMVGLGTVLGVLAGLASVRFVQTLLYGVKGTDLTMLVFPAAVLLAAVALAALPVVFRAVRIDPVRMLRAE